MVAAGPEREKIIDKVRKLRDHAISAEKIKSEAEAQAFAAMMQRLMSEHKILMSEIEHQKLDENDPVVKLTTDGYTWRKGKRVRVHQRVAWMEMLARVVAKAHYCKNAVIQGTAIQMFIGRKTDVEAAKMAFDYLATAAQTLASAAYREAHKRAQQTGMPWNSGYRESWLIGFNQRLEERYDEELAAIKAKWANSGTALIRLKDAVTVVDEFMKMEHFRKGTRLNRPEITNMKGYQDGRKAAEGIALKESGVKLNAETQVKIGAA